ncbi:hypothetical protein BCY89_00405 [Sphingobacterium siyangense]|uniref:Uncharacterized protein n=1 Tax=Sphingobacterium siyangense TaxID=459529 RepID=A0A420GA17_9SPHI|nr:hypothetical protein BCY89_00405 [Sphingobacterium siyangense]
MIWVVRYKMDHLTIFEKQGKYTAISDEFDDVIGMVFQERKIFHYVWFFSLKNRSDKLSEYALNG